MEIGPPRSLPAVVILLIANHVAAIRSVTFFSLAESINFIKGRSMIFLEIYLPRLGISGKRGTQDKHPWLSLRPFICYSVSLDQLDLQVVELNMFK